MTVDFTSALFLGLRHDHSSLAPWEQLTTGRPPMFGNDGLAPEVARLLDAERALVRRTSLHALVDVLTTVVPAGGEVLHDEGCYPIAELAAAAASARGIRSSTYRHHDAGDLAARTRRSRRALAVLTDGWCSSCSRPAPIADLARVAHSVGAPLVIDDTLAVGVLGAGRARSRPFGSGGGGIAPWLEVGEPTVVVASLAKGFGVPLAVIGGSAPIIAAVRKNGESGLHASGPTAADCAAVQRVLSMPARELDSRRDYLAGLTTELRRTLVDDGWRPVGWAFPFTLVDVGDSAVALERELRRRGCAVLPLSPRCREQPRAALGVALRTDHSRTDLVRLRLALRAARRCLHRRGVL